MTCGNQRARKRLFGKLAPQHRAQHRNQCAGSSLKRRALRPHRPAAHALLLLAALGGCGGDSESAAPPPSKLSQTIDFKNPGDQFLDNKSLTVEAESSSGLSVAISSKTPQICSVEQSSVSLIKEGECQLVAEQSGNQQYDAANSVEISFAVLPPEPCEGEAIATERIFLQQLNDNQVIIRWRAAASSEGKASQLCFGTDPSRLPKKSMVEAELTELNHWEVTLSGLDADTQYFYSIGAHSKAAEAHFFRTAPVSGTIPKAGKTRLWIVGDSGVGGYNPSSTGSKEVMNGIFDWIEQTQTSAPNLLLMLGDNAYNDGTDEEYQHAVFDIYSEILPSTPIWPAVGNHEMGIGGGSVSSDPNSYISGSVAGRMPFLDIFNLPSNGEVGGIPSGTELYYSFDYANLHVVSLDSQLSIRDEFQRAVMRDWLKEDLASNFADWCIIIFHHPPYSKGSHDSDFGSSIDAPMTLIREEFTQIFEDYGVDLVFAGHSHIYERSAYLNGHRGKSDTFSPEAHGELTASGILSTGGEGQVYSQISASGVDDKVVYTVAGNGGKISGTSPGFPHPAHILSDLSLGSVIIDADHSVLAVKYINSNGVVIDSYEIVR